VHLASSFYDLAGFRIGASTLRPFEVSEVGDVTGRRLVHLQCHTGLDTLSWARRGALVCGLDFSPPAIEAASALAASLGLPAAFVVADVYDAVAAFGGRRFDIVYTGSGALVWLPDVFGWARVVAGLLAPGCGSSFCTSMTPAGSGRSKRCSGRRTGAIAIRRGNRGFR
jgi:2-polyprenyl-3-methyl-5-hydroxy-6-metoxy-1,4-benzoquinol methylase